MDNFKDQTEFYYVKKEADKSEKGNDKRKDDKWWLPTCKVPPNGLSEMTQRWLQSQKESVNQVLKAAMAINAQVLTEMEIPENYIDSLPKVQIHTENKLVKKLAKSNKLNETFVDCVVACRIMQYAEMIGTIIGSWNLFNDSWMV